jgi:hypothetical protein
MRLQGSALMVVIGLLLAGTQGLTQPGPQDRSRYRSRDAAASPSQLVISGSRIGQAADESSPFEHKAYFQDRWEHRKVDRGQSVLVAELDTNHDARIGLYEWKVSGCPFDEFQRMDRNNDGFLTVEEVLAYRAKASEPARRCKRAAHRRAVAAKSLERQSANPSCRQAAVIRRRALRRDGAHSPVSRFVRCALSSAAQVEPIRAGTALRSAKQQGLPRNLKMKKT